MSDEMKKRVNPDILDSVPESSLLSLHDQAKIGNVRMVSLILEKGYFNIDEQDENGKTPLMLAMDGNHSETIHHLIYNGSNIYLEDKSGRSALRMAFALDMSHTDIVMEFLMFLQWECSNDSHQLGLKLSRAGCPLYFAVFLDDSEVTRIMLEEGCAIDVKDPFARVTALHAATGRRSYDNVKLLLEYGADINAVDLKGMIPVGIYQPFDDSDQELEMLKMFIDRDTAWTMFNDDSEIMQLAGLFMEGKPKAVRMFLARSNIDWFATDAHGSTPIHYLCENENLLADEDVFEGLRGKRINVNAVDRLNFTALSKASTRCHKRLVEILLDCGADPNIKESIGSTVLFILPYLLNTLEHPRKKQDTKEIFMTLLERGADPQIVVGGNTVFDSIMKSRTYSLAEAALGQLALNQLCGIPITDNVQSTINLHSLLKHQFELCKLQIDIFLDTMIRDHPIECYSISDILVEDEKVLDLYARRDGFSNGWERCNECCFNSYYARILQRKFQKITRIAKLLQDIPDLVCEIMGIKYDSYPNIVDKITDYVI